MYFKGLLVQSWGKRPAIHREDISRVCQNKNNRIAIRLGAMRFQKVSHMCIFPSDGTNRIRFTGKGYQAHSQPDASSPPKTHCSAI